MIRVVIPYRGMPCCLNRMLNTVDKMCLELSKEFSFVVLEQSEDGRRFNLGKLINIGYSLTKEAKSSDTLDENWFYMFHPVDMVPTQGFSRYLLHLESFSKNPKTGVLGFTTRTSSGYYKAAIFKPSHYEMFNGFTNNFWGYGAEDDELFARLKILDNQMTSDEIEFDSWFEESTGVNHGVPQSPDLLLGLDHHSRNIFQVKSLTKDRILVDGLSSLDYRVLQEINLTNKIKKVLVQL